MFQLPYSLQVVQPLKVLFGQDEFSGIPDIQLKENSDLNLIASNVASLALTLDPTMDQKTQVGRIFDSISEYFHDNRNILRVQTIEHTSKGFAATLENSYTTLNEVITPTVDSIKKNINERYTQLMIREHAEELIESPSIESIENNYTVLDWGNITTPMMRNEILEIATKNANLKNAEMSRHNLGYITAKSDFSNEFREISLPKEVNDTILGKLISVLVDENSGITELLVKTAWNFVTKKGSYKTLCQDNKIVFGDVRNVAENCVKLRGTTEAMHVLCEAIPKIAADDLSTETLNFLSTNANAVQKTTYATQYWMLAAKELTFSDKLIMTKNILNGPVYHEFVQQGKTITDVHNYMKAFHNSATVPVAGIRTDIVLSSDSLEALDKVNSRLRANEKFIKSKCLVGAFEFAIRKFITSGDLEVMFPNTSDEAFRAKFIKVAMIKADHIGGDVANLDKILYDLIIGVFYSDSLVSTLYKYMGRHFDNLIDSSGDDVTNEKIIESQCSAVTELLIDYLFKHVVE